MVKGEVKNLSLNHGVILSRSELCVEEILTTNDDNRFLLAGKKIASYFTIRLKNYDSHILSVSLIQEKKG